MPRSKGISQKKADTEAAGTKRLREEEKVEADGSPERETTGERASPTVKRTRTGNSAPNTRTRSGLKQSPMVDRSKLDAVLRYGSPPLHDDAEPASAKILALVLHAMLVSARISHQLAEKSFRCLLEAGYHHLETLKKSTWQERTEVLTKGGYTRYREKTATALGELADLVQEKYDGDLNNLVHRANSNPSKIRTFIQEIKGIGKVGTDLFFDDAQGQWSCLAPFIDPRSLDTAKKCGLGDRVKGLWEAVGNDPQAMCRLCSALSVIRLEKREKEFQ